METSIPIKEARIPDIPLILDPDFCCMRLMRTKHLDVCDVDNTDLSKLETNALWSQIH